MGGATRFIRFLSTPFLSLLPHRPSHLIFLRRLFSITTHTRYLTLSPSIRSFNHNLHTQPLKAHSPNQSLYIKAPHPWPEWTQFISTLNDLKSRYVLNYRLHAEDAFDVNERKKLPDEFLRDAASSLAFARSRPFLIRVLSKRDIRTIMIHGTPFLFQNVLDTARKMRNFLDVDGANVLECEKASTVDIMKYILSYASKPVGSSVVNSPFRRELVGPSIRNLLLQIVKLSFRNMLLELEGLNQTPKDVPHVQLMMGNWICPKCSFMNFARNLKCLECEESRPKRQLDGGEWNCPQCNFFNFSKNMACLKCDCTHPGKAVSQSGSRDTIWIKPARKGSRGRMKIKKKLPSWIRK